MRMQEFVQPYVRDMTPETIHKGEYSRYIDDAQDWSHRFGQLLHDYMSGADTAQTGVTLSEGYEPWLYENLVELRLRGSGADSEVRSRIVSETNMHYMNHDLLPMWRPILGAPWDARQRRQAIAASREELAISGLVDYEIRRQFLATRGSAALFEGDTSFYDAINGATQEVDAALVLLDVIYTHDNIVLLPAPLQFERGVDSSCNADHILLDIAERRAVGVQRSKQLYVVMMSGAMTLTGLSSPTVALTSTASRPCAPGGSAPKKKW